VGGLDGTYVGVIWLSFVNQKGFCLSKKGQQGSLTLSIQESAFG